MQTEAGTGQLLLFCLRTFIPHRDAVRQSPDTVSAGQRSTQSRQTGWYRCPRKKQPFGQRSRQSLSELVSQKYVSITGEEYDRYGRLLGTVWSGQTDINAVQLQKGMAWAYRFKGQISISEYEKIENEAKKSRAGLWSSPSQTEPWLWRRGQHKVDK
ncbi:TPA: thermonuclease family protein [Escherichia coli]|uniref:thermonuclease family protein n=1 Tax=Escherichia coli TaxID=562 RepID=UPI00370F6B5D